MPSSLVTISYLVAGLLFIFSLAGLSAQESARRGNVFGMAGMLLAVVVTALGPGVSNYGVKGHIIGLFAHLGGIPSWRLYAACT